MYLGIPQKCRPRLYRGFIACTDTRKPHIFRVSGTFSNDLPHLFHYERNGEARSSSLVCTHTSHEEVRTHVPRGQKVSFYLHLKRRTG